MVQSGEENLMYEASKAIKRRGDLNKKLFNGIGADVDSTSKHGFDFTKAKFVDQTIPSEYSIELVLRKK